MADAESDVSIGSLIVCQKSGGTGRITPLSKWLVKGVTRNLQLDYPNLGDLFINHLPYKSWDDPASRHWVMLQISAK